MQVRPLGALLLSASPKTSQILQTVPLQPADRFAPCFGMTFALGEATPKDIVAQIAEDIKNRPGAEEIIQDLQEQWVQKKFSPSQSDHEALLQAVLQLTWKGRILARQASLTSEDPIENSRLQEGAAKIKPALETLYQALTFLQAHIEQALQQVTNSPIKRLLPEVFHDIESVIF